MKVLVLAAVLILAMTASVAIAKYISPGNVEKSLTKVLAEKGFKCTVKVKDYDKNGVLEIVIKCHSAGDNEIKAVLLGAITGAVGVVAKNISWEADKVLLVLGENEGWHATVQDCLKCYELAEGGAPDDKVGECVLGIWKQVDI